MKKLFSVVLLSCLTLLSAFHAQAQVPAPAPYGPIPTENQLRWQDMEMYAFIHYSLNTYTDQEWGYGDEDPSLFNPSGLDCRQWARVCKQAGMKGIIFTAKHHCGFCMWPSKYTEYSVKSSPWKNGQGDVVRELAEACREEGLEYAVYLSPWDRNHPDYGKPEYVTYFRNQLHELLTEYGDMFEVWFDGANGGDGWYGGANERRNIDRTTYYEWPETYNMIRELQPGCLIWNDGSDRGDLRWVGTEAGYVGETNWSLLNHDGAVSSQMLRYGLEDGDSWVPGETNTSIRPGWFYHENENSHVKSLSKLMDTYYKSVGRNSCLLLNFPIAPNGRIHPTDSLRGIAFNKMVHEVFKTDLARKAKVTASNTRGGDKKYRAKNVLDSKSETYWATDDSVTSATLTIDFKKPVEFNRFLAEEYIALGQRVKKFRLEAFAGGKWVDLRDELVKDSDGLTTIGHRRIICFPTITATRLRFTILDSKACPLISRISVYRAPDLTPDIPDSGEKKSSSLNVFLPSPNQLFVELAAPAKVCAYKYLPPQDNSTGTVTHYKLSAMTSNRRWVDLAEGEFSNIVNNPIWQTINFEPVETSMLRLEAVELSSGERVSYEDIEVIPYQEDPADKKDWENPAVKEDGNLKIETERGSMVIDRSGALVSWTDARGRELLAAPLEPYFWKPVNENQAANNYERRLGAWKDAAAERITNSFDWSVQDGTVRVSIAQSLPVGADYTLTYTVDNDGRIMVRADYLPTGEDLPLMPKFGMRMRLKPVYDQVTWHGRGPWENYPDRKLSAKIDQYTLPLDEFCTDYIRPQDNGNRCDVRWLELSGKTHQGGTLKVEGCQPLCIRAWDYGEEDLTVGHPYELSRGRFVNLNIDLNIHGVGGVDTWGGRTLDKYTIDANQPMSYSYILSYE